MDKSEKLPSKMYKMDTVSEQLELRESNSSEIACEISQTPFHHHQLPLSPVSLATPPSSPDPSESGHTSSPASPNSLPDVSRKTSSDLQIFAEQLISQTDAKPTVGKLTDI